MGHDTKIAGRIASSLAKPFADTCRHARHYCGEEPPPTFSASQGLIGKHCQHRVDHVPASSASGHSGALGFGFISEQWLCRKPSDHSIRSWGCSLIKTTTIKIHCLLTPCLAGQLAEPMPCQSTKNKATPRAMDLPSFVGGNHYLGADPCRGPPGHPILQEIGHECSHVCTEASRSCRDHLEKLYRPWLPSDIVCTSR